MENEVAYKLVKMLTPEQNDFMFLEGAPVRELLTATTHWQQCFSLNSYSEALVQLASRMLIHTNLHKTLSVSGKVLYRQLAEALLTSSSFNERIKPANPLYAIPLAYVTAAVLSKEENSNEYYFNELCKQASDILATHQKIFGLSEGECQEVVGEFFKLITYAYIPPKLLAGKNTLLREFMRRARKKAGLSQEAIVARSPLIRNQSMVARIEARPMKTKLKILMSYMEAVGVDGDEFLMFYKRILKDA